VPGEIRKLNEWSNRGYNSAWLFLAIAGASAALAMFWGPLSLFAGIMGFMGLFALFGEWRRQRREQPPVDQSR
jgi:hypothetical protein